MLPAAVQGAPAIREQQVARLASIPAFYVPEEAFGADGDLPPMPDRAFLAPQPGFDLEALGDPAATFPRVGGRRERDPLTSWRGVFRTEYFVYQIEQINAPGQGLGINEGAAFRIVSRTLKRTADHANNRTFAFEQRWAPNPNFWANPDLRVNLNSPDGRQVAVRVAEEYGLAMNELMPDGGLPLFRALPTNAFQPFIFYVKNLDPKFAHDNRSFLSGQQFDELVAQPPAGMTSQSMVGLSSRPQVDRQVGGRQPQQVMGGFAAHQFMGAAGRPGQQGQLASHEWCHLIGDGDSGPNEIRNLVIGTNAVNTEQLAMETALRRYVPRFRTLGMSIQLRVTALTTDPPVQIPGSGVNPRQAKWISYQIGLVPIGDTNNASPDVVHRQIMDAERGTITSAEFTLLHSIVSTNLRSKAMALAAAQDAHQAGTGV